MNTTEEDLYVAGGHQWESGDFLWDESPHGTAGRVKWMLREYDFKGTTFYLFETLILREDGTVLYVREKSPDKRRAIEQLIEIIWTQGTEIEDPLDALA